MPIPRFLSALARLAVALLLALVAVKASPLGPGARVAAETITDFDDDCEVESAAVSAPRQTPTPKSAAARSTRPARPLTTTRLPSEPSARLSPSLGARLRC